MRRWMSEVKLESGSRPNPAVRLVPTKTMVRLSLRGVDTAAPPVARAAVSTAALRVPSPPLPPPHPAAAAAAASATSLHFQTALMLVVRQLTKSFPSGGRTLTVVRDVSFTIPDGAFVAIVGPSGSGKTTLLGLLAGLDTPTAGSVLLDGAELGTLSEDERAKLRGEKVGFVFQSFQLIPTLTAAENIAVPLELRGARNASVRARTLLDRIGLAGRADHLPAQLSGGEQQRVALARAFANAPRVLFADEPTGNLDSATGDRIIELLEELNRESGTTIVLVTHDTALASRAKRIIRLSDGAVVDDRELAA